MTLKRIITEFGTGNDLHGGDYTKAAVRAVQDAVHHSSLSLIRSLGVDARTMQVEVTIGVQRPDRVDAETVKTALPHGQVGEVFMRPKSGPGTTYRYIGAEAKSMTGGWESLGDMGHLDADGYLYLSDRQTDMILSGGANIYPAEVEAAIDAFPGVRSSAVIGLPHEDLGNAIHAIVDAPHGTVTTAALLAHLTERLVRYKIPRTVEFVTEPLRDDAGKVRRKALRDERLK